MKCAHIFVLKIVVCLIAVRAHGTKKNVVRNHGPIVMVYNN